MWNTENSRKVALAEGRYMETEHRHTGKQKLSSGMAMIGGAMILIFDVKGAYFFWVVLAFIVLFFAVVASLTDK